MFHDNNKWKKNGGRGIQRMRALCINCLNATENYRPALIFKAEDAIFLAVQRCYGDTQDNKEEADDADGSDALHCVCPPDWVGGHHTNGTKVSKVRS